MGKAENYVEEYLHTQSKKYGFLCYKFTAPGTRGVPDRIVIHDGITTYIETKSPVGNTSAIQKKRIKEMREHGADVRICHTRKAIDAFFKEFVTNYESGISRKPTAPPATKTRQQPVKIIQPLRN